jgi:hypothetical protein
MSKYGSVLNFVPIGFDGYCIELMPIGRIEWRWSIRLGRQIMKCTSSDFFETREMAFAQASAWWWANAATYWNP